MCSFLVQLLFPNFSVLSPCTSLYLWLCNILFWSPTQWRSFLCTLFGFSIFQCSPWYDSCSWTGKSSGSKNANNTTSTTGSTAIHRSVQSLGGGQIARYQELLLNWDLYRALFVSVTISVLSKYSLTHNILNLDLWDTSSIVLYILWDQLIPHKEHIFCFT